MSARVWIQELRMQRDFLFPVFVLTLSFAACSGAVPGPRVEEGRAGALPASSSQSAGAATAAAGKPSAPPAPADLDDELAQFSRHVIPADASRLSAGDEQAARKLVEAGALIERAFWQQSYRRGWEIRTRLEGSSSPRDRKLLDLLLQNAGPFNRLLDYRPFLGGEKRPKGGGFYPENLTAEELDAYVAAHPEEKEALLSPYTVVHRQGDRLVAVPFNREYAEWIGPAVALIREAAALVDDPGMAHYLRTKAEALASDSYGESDRAFLGARGSSLVVFVGPHSAAYDELKEVKRAYSLTVGIRDEAATREVAAYRDHLEEIERRLPLAGTYRRADRGVKNAVEVVDDLFRAGAVAHGNLGTMLLPSDPKARPEGGRNLFWRNVLEARGEALIRPIARALLAPGEERNVTPRAYFDISLVHYVAHAVGPDRVAAKSEGAEQATVKEALGDVEATIEETKAELAGLVALEWAVSQRGADPARTREHYATFIPHTLQILYQGTRDWAPRPHADGAQLILAWCREAGALVPGPDGRWRIEEERLAPALRALLTEILEIQTAGDRERALRLLDRYAALSPELKTAAERVGAVRPLTLEPAFEVRWR